MNEEGNELPSTGRRASWGAWDQGLVEPEGMVYKIQSICQLRKRIFIVASPMSGHSAFARMLLVTRGSHFTFLSLWVPSTLRGSFRCSAESLPSPALSGPRILNPFWVSDPEGLLLCQLTAALAEGRVCTWSQGLYHILRRYFQVTVTHGHT